MMTISEAAKFLGVSIQTLRNWDKNGILRSIKLHSKHRRYLIEDLTNYINDRRSEGLQKSDRE